MSAGPLATHTRAPDGRPIIGQARAELGSLPALSYEAALDELNPDLSWPMQLELWATSGAGPASSLIDFVRAVK
jgi:hypothetical protein